MFSTFSMVFGVRNVELPTFVLSSGSTTFSYTSLLSSGLRIHRLETSPGASTRSDLALTASFLEYLGSVP